LLTGERLVLCKTLQGSCKAVVGSSALTDRFENTGHRHENHTRDAIFHASATRGRPRVASFLNESADQTGRPLVLRPIRPHGPAHVTHLLGSRARTGAGDQVWELADPWGSAEGSTVALAVTRRVGDMQVLLRITVIDGAPPETVRCLVQQLVAALRRTDACVVASSVDDADLRKELLAAGFVSMPDEPIATHPRTPLGRTWMILQL
jgi:hypothetical protein